MSLFMLAFRRQYNIDAHGAPAASGEESLSQWPPTAGRPTSTGASSYSSSSASSECRRTAVRRRPPFHSHSWLTAAGAGRYAEVQAALPRTEITVKFGDKETKATAFETNVFQAAKAANVDKKKINSALCAIVRDTKGEPLGLVEGQWDMERALEQDCSVELCDFSSEVGCATPPRATGDPTMPLCRCALVPRRPPCRCVRARCSDLSPALWARLVLTDVRSGRCRRAKRRSGTAAPTSLATRWSSSTEAG